MMSGEKAAKKGKKKPKKEQKPKRPKNQPGKTGTGTVFPCHPIVLHPSRGYSQREKKAMSAEIRACLSIRYGSSVHRSYRSPLVGKAVPRSAPKPHVAYLSAFPTKKPKKERMCLEKRPYVPKRAKREQDCLKEVFVLKHLPISNFRAELLSCEAALRNSGASLIVPFRLKALKTTNVEHAWTDLKSLYVLVAEFTNAVPKPAFVAAMRWAVHCRYKLRSASAARKDFVQRAFQTEKSQMTHRPNARGDTLNAKIHCCKKQRKLRRDVLRVPSVHRDVTLKPK